MTYTRHILSGAMLAAILLLVGGWHMSNRIGRVVLLPGSQLWIDGSSTVNSFTCDANEIFGYGVLEDARNDRDAEVEIAVPVRQFDCGKRRMNQDMYEALKADEYPTIEYVLDDARLLTGVPEPGDEFSIQTRGRLTIAGAEREITMVVKGERLSDGTYRVEGSEPLAMSDFGVDPPTALLGLVKAHDRIVVRFDLVAGLDTTVASK